MKTKCTELNRKFSRISTLHELDAERDKLHYRLELKEMDIRETVDGVRSMFSVPALLNWGLDKIGVGNLANGVASGFSVVTSLLGRRKKNKSRKKRKTGCTASM